MSVNLSVLRSVRPSVHNAFIKSGEIVVQLIGDALNASAHLYKRVCPSVGLSVKISGFIAQRHIVGLLGLVTFLAAATKRLYK